MKFFKISLLVGVLALAAGTRANSASAASTPTLALANYTTTVGINVTGADSNAVVMFYFPNNSSSNSTNISYTSINIGQTNSSGSFSVSVGPNSYGLAGGVPVYVSVDGVVSAHVNWPVSSNTSLQTGTLTLSQQSVSLVTGESATIIPLNTGNSLLLESNSNPSVASAYIQSGDLYINGSNVGSTTVAVCASTAGCSAVSVSVQAATQSVTFSQPEVDVIAGQPAQSVPLYGSGSYYGLGNSNQNAVSASIDGTNLTFAGLAVGKSVLSVCASGLQCGFITINSLSPGSAITNPVVVSGRSTNVNLNLSQPPQLTSLSISSNDVFGSFFGAKSTLVISFGVNQFVTNVQLKVAGAPVSASLGSDGTYSASYIVTGTETLPLPVTINFTNASGLPGQVYFSIGSTAAASTASSVSSSANSSSSSYNFTQYLYNGSSGADVTALQQRLTTDGIYSGPITGTFGSLTEAAVEAYQTKHNVDSLGVVGPATRALLNQGI